jgi:hypothetical protein
LVLARKGKTKRSRRRPRRVDKISRVVAFKVEADGDLHIALQDATGDKPDIVVVEVSAKPQWCSVVALMSVQLRHNQGRAVRDSSTTPVVRALFLTNP